jgi:hypothetical protein
MKNKFRPRWPQQRHETARPLADERAVPADEITVRLLREITRARRRDDQEFERERWDDLVAYLQYAMRHYGREEV